MTAISKNVYVEKLNNIANKCNSKFHRKIKKKLLMLLKPIDVKSSTYVDFDIDSDDKDPNYKVGDHIRLSKYNTFAKGYIASWSEEVCEIKKNKNTISYRKS